MDSWAIKSWAGRGLRVGAGVGRRQPQEGAPAPKGLICPI
jgi:hypothetical protein